jgi:hypothetical protein
MFNLADFGQLGAFESLGAVAPGIYEQAQLYMDFRNNAARVSGAWSDAVSKLTTSRTSVAQMDSLDGWWGEFAANTPRISDKGLLIEEARTNCVRNNTMVGAVAGSPGTPPANWSISAGAPATIVGVGNENGIDYIDVRFAGVTTSTFSGAVFDTALTGAGIAAADQWTTSCFMTLVGGDYTNILTGANRILKFRYYLSPSGNTDVNLAYTAVPGALTANRAILTTTILGTPLGTGQVMYLISHNVGVPIDITLRFGWPQVEKGAFVTSPIKTSGAAATRSADDIKLNTFAWYAATGGTLFSEGVIEHAQPAGILAHFLSLHDTTANNLVVERISNGVQHQGAVVAGGVTQANLVDSTFVANANNKMALAFALNDFMAAYGGALTTPDVSGTIPVVTTLQLGGIATGGLSMDGYLKRTAYWNYRVPDAILQALTAG